MRINEITEGIKQRLDPKCWKGKHKEGTKIKGGIRVNNCVANEDYDPNGIPPGPEFKPTMPKGTVRVDVSDVYDWYKLGQHISNLKRADKKMFGKGPPSTIMAFGSEPEEHNYINDLEKIGLTTTDIDPIDLNQPKGMKRQKVDPTFNVNESLAEEEQADYEIRNLEKLDSILAILCKMVIEGQQEDSSHFGMVAAGVLDPDNNLVAEVNYPHEDGARVHAERAAMEAYVERFGDIPDGSIIITTLSPCSEHDDVTGQNRYGESCTELINNSNIHKVYCGYMDPSQGDDEHDERGFTLQETNNQKIRDLCKAFADTFLEDEIDESAAWRRKEGKNKKGGLNAKGVASYRREHPGSKLQTAVTTKPSKLKKGSKAAKRRKSFCARMGGMKGPMKKPNGKPTRKALALRKWNC